MRLSENEKSVIKDNVHKYVVINGIQYFCKMAENNCNEMIANRLANFVGINCAEYHLVKIDEALYYLSYSFNNLGKFKIGKEFIGLNYYANTLYNMWHAIENNYPRECKELMLDLVKVFIFDIFMLNGDRHAGNYAIVEEDGKPKIYIFDNESIFESIFRVELSPKFNKSDYLRNDGRIIRNPEATIGMKQNMELLNYFLATSSKEFEDLVIDFYNRMTPDVVYKVILDIEKDEDIIIFDKNYNMELYKRNYQLIGELLIDRGLINKEKGR